MKVRPLHDRVLLRREEEETKTASGIIIPDAAKEKPIIATVVAHGPGAFNEDGEERIPLDVKEGDRVLISKWAGTEVKIDGEELVIVKESDILAVIEDGKAKKKAA